MARDTNSFLENSLPDTLGIGGISTRMLLVMSLLIPFACSTVVTLVVARDRMQAAMQHDVADELSRSAQSFRDLERQRLQGLDRENALLADLPSLKALMTTNDRSTIRDGAQEFWKVSGNDLLALATPDGEIQASFTHGPATHTGARP